MLGVVYSGGEFDPGGSRFFAAEEVRDMFLLEDPEGVFKDVTTWMCERSEKLVINAGDEFLFDLSKEDCGQCVEIFHEVAGAGSSRSDRVDELKNSASNGEWLESDEALKRRGDFFAWVREKKRRIDSLDKLVGDSIRCEIGIHEGIRDVASWCSIDSPRVDIDLLEREYSDVARKCTVTRRNRSLRHHRR